MASLDAAAGERGRAGPAERPPAWPDVVGWPAAPARAVLAADGWTVTEHLTAWRGPLPAGGPPRVPAAGADPRVVALRPAGARRLDMVVAHFEADAAAPGLPGVEGG